MRPTFNAAWPAFANLTNITYTGDYPLITIYGYATLDSAPL